MHEQRRATARRSLPKLRFMHRNKHELPAILRWMHNALKCIPYVLRAFWLFFPGILFLLLATAVFWHLGQGKDVIRQCLEQPRWVGAIAVLAVIFWVFVTWYTARLVAYNHDELYKQTVTTANNKEIRIGKFLLFHGPRLIAFYIFAVLIIAFLQFDKVNSFSRGVIWSLLALQLGLYIVLHRFLAKYDLDDCTPEKLARLAIHRNIVRALIILACAVLILFWGNKTLLIVMTALLQFGFLFLVIVRRPLARRQRAQPARDAAPPHFLDGFLNWIFGEDRLQKNERLRGMKEVERSVFVVFNVLALFCLVFYAIAIFSLPLARFIGPLAFVFLAFGILLGIGNIVGLLSKRIGTNVFFIAIVIVFLFGLFTEPHRVRLTAADNTTAARPPFRDYLRRWITDASRYEQIKKSATGFPVFFVLADGGASRSGYWTASVLGRLTDETKSTATPFYQHLFCLSGASGGSVGNGTFLASLAHRDALLKTDTGFRKSAIHFLGSDFLSFTLARMLGPDLIAPVTYWLFAGDRAWALERSLEHPQGDPLLAENMQAPFSRFYPDMNTSHFLYPIVVFNTTRMQDGNPGVVSNFDLDTVAFGSRLDVMDSMPKGKMLRLSTSMILSARFPYISPAGRIRTSYFVDGGYFDNSGAGIVHEMLLEINRIKRDSLMQDIAPLLDKLRFYVIHITNSPYGSNAFTKVHPFNNDLAAPLLTLAGSYASQTNVNNTRLQNYLKELDKEPSYLQVNLYKPDLDESFPMNWVISKALRDSMDKRVYQIKALDSVINRLNRGGSNLFQGLDVQSAPKTDSAAAPKYGSMRS